MKYMELRKKNPEIGKSLLPFIKPSSSYYVWELDRIEEWYTSRPGVYVFWDWETAQRNDFNDRFKVDYLQLPLYIGKTDNLANRIIKHIKGETHTKAFAPYFYYVDIYDFQEIVDNCDAGVKERGIEYARLNTTIKNNQLTPIALTDLYEIYYIMRRIPIFNKDANRFASENLHEILLKKNRQLYLHRRFWSQYEATNVQKKIRINIGSPDSVENFFINNKINLEFWSKPNDFAKKLSAKWSIKDKSKRKYLISYIKQYKKEKQFPKQLITKGKGNTFSISLESILFYDFIEPKDKFENEYKLYISK
ncbi:hypothetical protein [Neobacillus sp. SAB-20_R2A]|uniref:hypothetical protein n=1 Tax=Neobacillus sp. SAB-20_R2A TaxID=3120519 RepID=UPI003C6E935D